MEKVIGCIENVWGCSDGGLGRERKRRKYINITL
jgi:hypothetical protein